MNRMTSFGIGMTLMGLWLGVAARAQEPWPASPSGPATEWAIVGGEGRALTPTSYTIPSGTILGAGTVTGTPLVDGPIATSAGDLGTGLPIIGDVSPITIPSDGGVIVGGLPIGGPLGNVTIGPSSPILPSRVQGPVLPYSYFVNAPAPSRIYVPYGETDQFPFQGRAYGSPGDRWSWYNMGGGGGRYLAKYYYPPLQ